ncbi:MAG: tRNA (adenosine(37)-N6)-threonylcarbamoyltransferase complex ATPase subunit type 1 TsaE [Arenicella sp.]
MTKTHYSAANTNEMHQCGQLIAASLSVPSVVYLNGDLGAGKTTLVQGFAQYFGYSDIVSSPTYNLIHEYPTSSAAIAHLDLYRLDDPEELAMLGLADLLNESSLLLIEWPEKGQNKIPTCNVLINIAYSSDKKGRDINVSYL